jgi:phage shock protein A
MSPTEGDRAVLAALIQEERRLEQQLEDARTRRDLWRGRLEKAQAAGRADLEEECVRQLQQVVVDGRSASAALDRVRMEKDMLRAEVKRSAQPEANTAYNDQLLDQFAALGVRPEDEELRRLSRDAAADDALERLKRQMRDGKK